MGASTAGLRKELDDCIETWLRPYITRLTRGELQPRPKVINDAVWGSIRLYQWEVAVLDTWLLQRLRYLRQLGVVHWVYPSGGHSRLEHSIGVVHQMEALLASIERSGKGAATSLLSDATHKLLRLAALLHDSGHAIMSHVSEAFIGDLPGVAELREELRVEFGPRKKPSASEAFAAIFVQSAAFRELLELPVVGASFIRDVPLATRQIAGLILGGPVIPGAAFLTFLVNGAFDADKLDYMPRDCLMTGVPCAVDVKRVVETVRVLTVPTNKVPDYAKWAASSSANIDILTLTGAGSRALGELAMARSLLYEKVYFHHKVRALEVMVRRSLAGVKQRSVVEWLNLVDDELLVGVPRDGFERLRTRDLLKRAVVLTSPDDGDGGPQTPAEEAWSDLMSELSEPAELTDDLRAEALKVADLLNEGRAALQAQAPEIDVPPINKIGLDQHAFLGDSVEEFTRASAALSGQRTEAGRRAAQQMVYIFAPEGAVLPVFVAARQLLRKRFALSVGPDAYRATRLDPEAIAAAEKTLAATSYFGEDPPAPIPAARIHSHRDEALETFLRTSRSRLDDLAGKFGQYQSFDEATISPAHIATFLRQFGTEPLARSALLMLEAIDFKDRRFFASALKGLLTTNPTTGVVCPFGAVGDSSAFISYLMNDVPAAVRREVAQLELALDPDGPGQQGDIILWDDFCGRAGHAATALQQWLGLVAKPEDLGLLLKETLVRPLNPQRAQAFRSRVVKIAFALARPTGLGELRNFLARHGLERVEVLPPTLPVPEANNLFDTATVIKDENDRRNLRTFLERRTRQALSHQMKREKDPWTQETLDRRILGYGNEAHLIAFSYNVPTVTLTALWAAGDAADGWQPLFIRRGKPST